MEEDLEEINQESQKLISEATRNLILFYATAFFVLVAVFSLFGFLFLVPFIIEPAYTTIQMKFDEKSTTCVTSSIQQGRGLTNCTWTSCKEGCTKEVYQCTRIFVDYTPKQEKTPDGDVDYTPVGETPETAPNRIRGARLFPNVKGCGYPPFLNCSVFNEFYGKINASFPCFYSRVDPTLVVTELNIPKLRRNMTLALVIPTVAFVLSVTYLAVVWYRVYRPRSDTARVYRAIRKKRQSEHKIKEGGDAGSGAEGTGSSRELEQNSPQERDMFINMLNFAVMDEMLSGDSLDSPPSATNSSNKGSPNETMSTTHISTTEGPIAQL